MSDNTKQPTPESTPELPSEAAPATEEAPGTEILRVPVLPLRDVVVFPGVTLPILAGRPASLRAVEAASETSERLLFTVLQREPDAAPDAENLHTTGTLVRIDQRQRGLSGTQLVITGLRRAVAIRYQEEDGTLMATVNETHEVPPQNPDDPAFVALHRELRERASEFAQRSGLPREAVESVIGSVSDPGQFSDLVAGYLDLPAEERQKLLETAWIEERVRLVLTHVQRQLSVLEAQAEIESKVQEEIGDRQREIFLREQMKAIQEELGEGEGGNQELAELKLRLDELELPEEVRREVDREFGRLSRMGREAMEAQVVRSFLETVAELPWNKTSEESIDLEEAERILEQDHYGLHDVKDRILEFLAVRQFQNRRRAAGEAATAEDGEDGAAEHVAKSPILLFVGPPGVGKTSIARSIARAMGREYHRISLGGARDEADIRGHRRTYVAAMPGRIIQGLKAVGTRNPVFLLDEIDKLGVSYQGNPASALLEVLDPAQNSTFTDHYLGVPFDLSQVLFIATANLAGDIPAPLLDRMELVEFSGYTEAEKLEIARRYLVPRQLDDSGLSEEEVRLDDSALTEVISRYTREAGVRQLEREIGRLLRKAARKLGTGKVDHLEVDAAAVREMLGRPPVRPEKASTADEVGVATGMFYTPVGGDILFVEVATMPGKGELILTGQLGEVMRESARAAWTYARAHADALGISSRAFERDLHVHVPAGAVPKDGPSAGVTIATAVVSALSGRPVRHDIAMTGEITLSGRVLPIGGVKEKILGAVRAGIRRFVLPKANEPDLEDLPQGVLAQIHIDTVDELGALLALTLRDAELKEGRLLFAGTPHGAARATPHDLH